MLTAEAKPSDRKSTSSRLDPFNPLEMARAFIADRYGDGTRGIHFHRGLFYAYDGRVYVELSADRLRAEIYKYLERICTPTQHNTRQVIDAAKAAAFLGEEIQPPSWLGNADSKPPAHECLPMANGVLHLPTRQLMPHDPALFAFNALDFEYDPAAQAPEWLKFLASVWPDDQQQIDTLQEWIGYELSGSTDQQKIGLMVGPKRSGKGTIARIKAELLGKPNVCNPTLGSLATNFGLQPLIGKMAATISDARLSGKADQHSITERLLAISGEDGITIDRKHQTAWTGRLGVRFLILSNELPRLADASGALASRFVVMVMRESFYGREDTGLTERLLSELPGIFNWALAGLDRLRERGHFEQPDSSKDAIEDLAELGSPIKAFIDDLCLISPTAEITVSQLYEAWREWCLNQGRSQPGTIQSFGQLLAAAVPGIRRYRPTSADRSRPRMYQGISLR